MTPDLRRIAFDTIIGMFRLAWRDFFSGGMRLDGEGASLRLDIPFTDKGDISLKKIGLELIVRVDGQKRTILLPPALAPYRPSSASFSDGSLLVSFSG